MKSLNVEIGINNFRTKLESAARCSFSCCRAFSWHPWIPNILKLDSILPLLVCSRKIRDFSKNNSISSLKHKLHKDIPWTKLPVYGLVVGCRTRRSLLKVFFIVCLMIIIFEFRFYILCVNHFVNIPVQPAV